MNQEFTGYIIKEDYDLNNLVKYGFWKTEPKDINPWWQCPFNITYNGIRTWDCELFVSREDRKLLMKQTEGCDLNKFNKTIEEMKQDGVFINE